MSEVLLANLFFIITGSAVIVVTVFLCIACYHIVKVVRRVRKMLDRMEAGAELVMEDMRVLRDNIANGNIFGKIVGAIAGAFVKPRSRRAKKEISSED